MHINYVTKHKEADIRWTPLIFGSCSQCSCWSKQILWSLRNLLKWSAIHLFDLISSKWFAANLKNWLYDSYNSISFRHYLCNDLNITWKLHWKSVTDIKSKWKRWWKNHPIEICNTSAGGCIWLASIPTILLYSIFTNGNDIIIIMHTNNLKARTF